MAKTFRNLFLVFLLLYQAGVLWGLLNIFDLNVLTHMLAGMPLTMEAEELWARPPVRTARWIAGTGLVGMTVFLPLWQHL